MNLLDKLYFILLVVTLGCYAIKYREKEKYVQPVLAILILWLLTTAIAVYLAMYAGYKNNLFVFHVSSPIEYCILILLFRGYIENTVVRKILAISVPLFILLSIFLSAFVQTPAVNNSYVIILESVILILTALYFLREILLLQRIEELHRFPMFWISVGILFYYTGTLIIEGMLNYLISRSMELARRAYRMSYLIKYVLFVLFIIAAYCSKRSRFYLKNVYSNLQ